MKLWGGRFHDALDPRAWALNTSLPFDQRLALQDIRGSRAWAKALKKAGLIAFGELNKILRGLETIQTEFQVGEFQFLPTDEDIHTAIERRLGELIGALAGKLHTGRSRNDQVATDFRLWLLENIPLLQASIAKLQTALLQRASVDLDILMPGYTHLQRAQPILLSHWWLAHFWPLQRDRQRLEGISQHTSTLPLGAGALAGAPFPVDRKFLARELGFLEISPNSLDAVSDRDFAVEFLSAAALCGVHLSRLAESIILFSTAEFNFFELSDSFATGSSLMPQKKNPDVFELARAKAGGLTGLLTGLLSTLKGLPSAYDKDLQEDKVPVFTAFDTLQVLLPVLANAITTLNIHAKKMREAIDSGMMATDLADYLVEKGIPFRQAHEITGKVVQKAARRGLTLEALPLDDYRTLSEAFTSDVYHVFDPQRSIARRNVYGGTAPQAVQTQIEIAQQQMLP